MTKKNCETFIHKTNLRRIQDHQRSVALILKQKRFANFFYVSYKLLIVEVISGSLMYLILNKNKNH